MIFWTVIGVVMLAALVECILHPRWLRAFLDRGKTNGELRAEGIPRPESLMVSMLSLKIVSVDPEELKTEGCYDTLLIPLSGGSYVEATRHYKNSSRKAFCTLNVRDPSYSRTEIVLSEAEQKDLLSMMEALSERKAKTREALKVAESQNASMAVLEELLGVKAEPQHQPEMRYV